jgi:hypothetical protein
MRRLMLAAACLLAPVPAGAASPVSEACIFTTKDGKEIALHGKVQVVTSFPDLTVEVVTSFPDLKVQTVETFPDSCGQWEFVESFPDFTVEYVTSFPDLKIEMVQTFPGLP